MEIKILVKENEKAELNKFIETCKDYGMELIREGGGKLPGFSGYYAELNGVQWAKVFNKAETLHMPDVSNDKVAVCDACGCNKVLTQIKCSDCGNTIKSIW